MSTPPTNLRRDLTLLVAGEQWKTVSVPDNSESQCPEGSLFFDVGERANPDSLVTSQSLIVCVLLSVHYVFVSKALSVHICE